MTVAKILEFCVSIVSKRPGHVFFLTTVAQLFNKFALPKKGAQDGFGGVGRTSRAAKDAKTAKIESATC